MDKFPQTVNIAPEALEESRVLRVRWDQAVAVLARTAAWYGGLLAAGVAAVLVILSSPRVPLLDAAGVILFSGLAAAGGIGLIVLLHQDGRYDYEGITRRRLPAEAPAEDAGRVADAKPGPLYRHRGPNAIQYGKVKLTPAQKAALAHLLATGELSLSGRKLAAAGVIIDRIQEAPPLHADLLALGYATRRGQTVEATADLLDHLEPFLPPTPAPRAP